MKNLSSLASDFNYPINYCFQILENISLAICFLSCFSVNACRSNRARVSASDARGAHCCSRELAILYARVPNIRLAAMFTAS